MSPSASPGSPGVVDLRGTEDAGTGDARDGGRGGRRTAAAAELVMGKSTGVPVAVIRGVDPGWFRESSVNELIRPPQEDLFR
ncbi:MAG: hypothetical protein R2705_23440 [Ilumatobacteraceae bacterium]